MKKGEGIGVSLLTGKVYNEYFLERIVPRFGLGSKPTKKIIVFSGAGISAESGISTFRDSNGLWENYSVKEICDIKTWQDNFEKVHQFYNQRRVQLSETQPNEAHKMVAYLKEKYKDDCLIVTQNIDNLFEKAGIPAEEIVHLHGELTKMHCTYCHSTWDIGEVKWDMEEVCPFCKIKPEKKTIKPYVVFFGEQAPMYKEYSEALMYGAIKDSVIVVVGTSGQVIDPFSQIVEHKEALKILNNLESSKGTKEVYALKEGAYNLKFFEPATTALPKIVEIIENLWDKK